MASLLLEDDEWIFSLRVPNSVGSSSPSSSGTGLVELRQRQPAVTPSRRGDTNLSEEEEEEDVLSNNISEDAGVEMSALAGRGRRRSPLEEETTQLLSDDRRAAAVTKESRHVKNRKKKASPPLAWKLESPFWSLQSETLLSITYCPAWQSLPEYTAQQQCCCSHSPFSLARVCGVRCCAGCCCCGPAPKDYVQETFSVHDIVNVVVVEQQSSAAASQHFSDRKIPGIGPCQMVRVFLRPMTTPEQCNVPAHLRQAWEAHVSRMQQQGSPSNSSSVREQIATVSSAFQQQSDKWDDDDTEQQHDGPVLTFCLPTKQTDPPLLWKVSLPEFPEHPIAVETITILDGQLILQQKQKDSPTHIFINGYQSWSFSGSVLRGQPQPGPALPDMFSRAFNTGATPPPPAATIVSSSDNYLDHATGRPFHPYYQSDFFTCITSDGRIAPRFSKERKFPFQQLLDETGGPAMILGWLSQHEQFGIVQVDQQLSRVRLHCSGHGQILYTPRSNDNNNNNQNTSVIARMTTDWAYAQLVHPHSYDEEPMANYLHAVAGYHQADPMDRFGLLTGWCSWYVYYENISAALLRDNLARLAALRDKVPTNVAVVDDGYMTAWGDWDSLKPKEFPAGAGLDVVARDIRAHGMRPGLWLAPYAADKHSRLVQDHPDWVIRSDAGIAANSSNCGKFFYGLDATHPGVRQHVHEAVRRAVHDWGFTVLKIDFLYACCLEGNGKYDLSISRAQAMHMALQTIREAAGPDVFLIGCGCPIASGIGYIDAMRVSADTGPTWRAALPLPWWDNGTLPSLRGMIRNTISRAPFGHRWWHNDPDCLMLGSHTSLTDDQVASAASIVAMTCGMLLLSDDLPTLSPARLSIVSKIFPLTGVSATVLDLHSTNDGLPSLLRLWCTDRYDMFESVREEMAGTGGLIQDHNATASYFARQASFRPDAKPANPTERRRNCIHVAQGMGTWTVVSLSNWSSKKVMLTVPPPALSPPPTHGWGDDVGSTDSGLDDDNHGYHVFGFWSSRYSWLASCGGEYDDDNATVDDFDHSVSKLLRPHETEVFHIKKVTPDTAQYIGTFVFQLFKRELSFIFLTTHLLSIFS